MSILSRYVLSAVARPMMASMFVVLFFLMARRLVRIHSILQYHRDAWSLTFEMMWYLLPYYLGVALPAALFVGLLFGYRRLDGDSEIRALCASGVSIGQLLKPTLTLALVMFGFIFFLFGWAQPYTRYEYRALINSPELANGYMLAAEGKFIRVGQTVLLIDDLHKGDRGFGKFFIFGQGEGAGGIVATARSGQLFDPEIGSDTGISILRLDGATVMRHDADGQPDPSQRDLTIATSSLSMEVKTGTRRLIRPRGLDEREFTLPELWQKLNDNEPRTDKARNALAGELSDRLVRTFLVLLLPVFALSFAIEGRRRFAGRSTGLGISIMLIYFAILFAGRWAATLGGVSPLFAQWLPFAAFSLLTGVVFQRAAFPSHAPGLRPDRSPRPSGTRTDKTPFAGAQ